MSNYPIKVKVEEDADAVKGSLGALLSSYADASSSEDDDQNVTMTTVKTEKVDDDYIETDSRMEEEAPTIGQEGVDVDYGLTRIKQEPGISDDEYEGSLTDFATIRVKNEQAEGGGGTGTYELSVEDFLEEPYAAPREIKVEVGSGTDDSEADSEDSEKEKEDSESEQEEDEENGASGGNKSKSGRKKLEGPKVKGELGLYDLPPIEDLHISVPHEECKPIGVIKSVVEPLVIVEANLDTPALNLDSVLFLDEGDRALGQIFDVIGPVKQPIYCVRFNSKEHIEKNKVEVGMPVYCAPKTSYTSYVFLAQLKRMKGSDASWMNDHEPPVEEVEYSDDELERMIKKKKRNRRARAMQPTEEDAMHKDDEHNPQANEGGNQFRGRKRNFRNQNDGNQPSDNRNLGNNFNNQSQFVPALVPGFIPANFMPPFSGYQNGANYQPRRGTHRYGGGGGRNFQRFRPPISGPPPPRVPQYQPEFTGNIRPFPCQPYPWRPPNQWRNQQPTPSNFNFTGYGPYQAFTPPRQPPPPPPPPPGE